MQRQKIIIAIAIVAIVLIVGSVGLICLNGSSGTNPQPSPTPTPELSVQEQVRDAAVSYIQTNHAETAQFLANINWSGGRQDSRGLVGAETYIYNSTNWAIIIKYPVVPNPIYTVNATYSSGSTTIQWDGTYSNGTVTETNYAFSP
jgi:hypothetical protein